MIQVVCGGKGKGKTKSMLEIASNAQAKAEGTVIFVDKSADKMYDLNRGIRLINIKEYPVKTAEGFVGFVAGLLSGDNDIETLLIDSLLQVANISNDELEKLFEILNKLSEGKTFVLSISIPEKDLPELIRECVVVSC